MGYTVNTIAVRSSSTKWTYQHILIITKVVILSRWLIKPVFIFKLPYRLKLYRQIDQRGFPLCPACPCYRCVFQCLGDSTFVNSYILLLTLFLCYSTLPIQFIVFDVLYNCLFWATSWHEHGWGSWTAYASESKCEGIHWMKVFDFDYKFCFEMLLQLRHVIWNDSIWSLRASGVHSWGFDCLYLCQWCELRPVKYLKLCFMPMTRL